MKNFGKSIAFALLSSLLVLLNNCASDESIKEAHAKNEETIKEKPVQLSVDAMVVADPPLLAPVPIIPVVPLPPLPILPPPPPPVPLILPGPEPFLNGTKTVPPEWANFVSARGQLPSRHGNRTFLYSFETDVRHKKHHRHHDRHDRHDHNWDD